MTPSTELKVSNLLFYAVSQDGYIREVQNQNGLSKVDVTHVWSPVIFCRHSTREPVSAARDDKQDDPHYSAGPHRYLCLSNLMLEK